MADEYQMRSRQRILGQFGELALRSENLDEILSEACRLIAEAMGTGRAKVLEIDEDSRTLFVRAGVGWADDVAGKLRLPMSENTSETYSIRAGEPVITQDIANEHRFDVPEFMKKAGVVALANVPIRLPGGKAFGLLQVDATEPRDFGEDETNFLRTYATILGPVIDRLRKVASLAEGKKRFRLIVESARDYAIFMTDAQDRITDWLPGAQTVFGWTAEEAIGRPGSMLFTPDDQAQGEPQKEVDTARASGSAPNVRWHIRKDGTPVFIEGAVTALYDDNGSVQALLKIGQDVTERRRANEQLERSEALFRSFTDAAPSAVWMRDASSLRFEYVSPAFEGIFGVPYDAITAADGPARWSDLISREDRPSAAEAVERARSGETQVVEYRIESGERARWVRDIAFPIYDGKREPVSVGGISIDVTEEKATRSRLEVVLAELQHRTRNLLGVVTAVAQETARRSDSLPDFMNSFTARLNALARVNGLLSRLENGDRISFDQLLRTELSAHGALDGRSDHVIMEGPSDVRLRSTMVQTLALALHELATNAVKHGALSGPEGRLHIGWRVFSDHDGARLEVSWLETGVQIEHNEIGRGYGRELIERALPYQLKAKTSYKLTPDGVHCTVSLPISTSAGGEE